MPALTEFYDKIAGKTASVVGIGISNRPLIDFLTAHGVRVTARDMKPRESFGELADELESRGVRLVCGEDYLENLSENYIFRAPGIRPDRPEFVDAVKRGSILTSEMELFIELCPCRIFAVTGSDGKTTSTTLTYKMLELEQKKLGSGARVFVGGNIGRPLLPEIDSIREGDLAVVELSSFQLQSMTKSPELAAITNVTPNHLNWHTGMEEYTAAKTNIFRHVGNRRLVLNYGCEATRVMADETDSEVSYFSAKCVPELGNNVKSAIFDLDGVITERTASGDEAILDVSTIKIPGRHNVENYMTAIALTRGYVSLETIREIARDFGGVEHRCELVRKFEGVSYYNSSIDSSPTRTEAALRAFKQRVIVICGGYDKQIPYEPLAKPLVDCARCVVLTGATAPKIKSALLAYDGYDGTPEILDADSFEEAVAKARSYAKPGDVVILSPASASFDRFKNFEERGEYFKKIVRDFH